MNDADLAVFLAARLTTDDSVASKSPDAGFRLDDVHVNHVLQSIRAADRHDDEGKGEKDGEE